MAIIEVFVVAASDLPIDPGNTTDIPQGLLVTLDSTGAVTPADGANNATTGAQCIGIAGDTRSSGTTSFTPESNSALSRNPKTSLVGSLVMGALGAARRYTQNHVADQYNEVLASGRMTVYHSGGEFWTDQYEVVKSNNTSVCTYTPATYLYASASTETAGQGAGNQDDIIARGGRFSDEAPTNTQKVGVTLHTPTAYPSGVPGTDTAFNTLPEGGNSLSFGQFLKVKLTV